ncbi:hypothetical protein EOL96_08940 [Candidatus Saccharibacteria bacterium]|nr:hypothetical protein [Candidatus Saccharibacteria bacterium]
MATLSQTARLLELFKKRKILTNRYIADHVCLRYSARIAELRAEGHIIVATRVKDGLFAYSYKGNKEENAEAEMQAWLDKIKATIGA